MSEIEKISLLHSGYSRLTGTAIDNIPKLLFSTNLIYYLSQVKFYRNPTLLQNFHLKFFLGCQRNEREFR